MRCTEHLYRNITQKHLRGLARCGVLNQACHAAVQSVPLFLDFQGSGAAL